MARPINNIRKITRIAKTSLGVLLPAGMLKDLGWRERQRVLVKRMPRGILIRDAMTKRKKN